MKGILDKKLLSSERETGILNTATWERGAKQIFC
jgi:hypothetical protein